MFRPFHAVQICPNNAFQSWCEAKNLQEDFHHLVVVDLNSMNENLVCRSSRVSQAQLHYASSQPQLLIKIPVYQ